MKNRAKCKKCLSIIESLHRTDYVICKCNEIAVYGGPELMQCSAIDWNNFLRVDDMGNEIVVKVQNTKDIHMPMDNNKPDKKDLLTLLDKMIESIDNLPKSAMNTPVTHYDYQTLLLLLSSLFKSDLPKN